MPNNYVCGWCGTTVPTTVAWPNLDGAVATHPEQLGQQARWKLYECAACGRYTISVSNWGELPGSWDGIDASHAPDRVRADYLEAVRCQKANAHRAAATMARRATQAACLDLGANPNTNLYEQIDELQQRGEFSVRLAKLAHQIRFFGNDGAHPSEDGIDDVTSDEAEQAIRFLEHLIQHIYVIDQELKIVQGEE